MAGHEQKGLAMSKTSPSREECRARDRGNLAGDLLSTSKYLGLDRRLTPDRGFPLNIRPYAIVCLHALFLLTLRPP